MDAERIQLLLREIWEFAQDRHDVEDREDGTVRANEWMQLTMLMQAHGYEPERSRDA